MPDEDDVREPDGDAPPLTVLGTDVVPPKADGENSADEKRQAAYSRTDRAETEDTQVSRARSSVRVSRFWLV